MELNQYINKAVSFEEAGYVEEAIQLCEKCIQAFPEYRDDICLEIAKMNYRSGNEETALLQLIALYEQTGNTDLFDLAVQAYYGERQQEFEKRYSLNCCLLNKYPHFYGTGLKKEPQYVPVYQDSDVLWYCDTEMKQFKSIDRVRISNDYTDDVYVGGNLLWVEDIVLLEKLTRKIDPFMDEENPLLLVYQKDFWELLLQTVDLKELLELDRILFYSDLESLQNSLANQDVQWPQKVVVTGMTEEIMTAIRNAENKYQELIEQYKTAATAYYQKNSDKIIEHLNKNPRILFVTSRFSTAVQYHARDCRKAAEKAGCKTELLIEKNRLRLGISAILYLKTIVEFKPDLYFSIDHFRFESSLFKEDLEELVWLTWIQDPLPAIMDKSSPAKLGKRDIILNHYTTWEDFWQVGYDKHRVIEAPVPANEDLYKHYELTQEEIERYSCDLCFVCHASDVDEYIKAEMEKYPPGIHEHVYTIYKGYQDFVYESGEMFFSKTEFKRYIRGVLEQCSNLVFSDWLLDYMAEDMSNSFNQRVYRQALADWLLDAGFHNIKLWGSGWANNEKYTDYAMGVAENGETLSKIYQASKIVVGNNVNTTAAARAWEAMLSGAFYMSNYIPPERDAVDIRKIMKADEELVMFYNKEDFLQKTEYYLTHEKERQRMIEIGHKIALEKMTYEKLMSRIISEIPEKLRLLRSEEAAEDKDAGDII